MKKKVIEYEKKIYCNNLFIDITNLIIPLILFFLKIKIKKIEGKIPKKGPLLIAAHHEDIADQFIISLSAKRRLFWVADTTPKGTCLADTYLIKWLMLRLGAIPIDKENPKRNVNLFDYALYLLKKGRPIVFFPESYIRCERNNKKFGEFKEGVIRLALEYEKRYNKKIPIYPVGLHYTKKDNIKKANLNIGKAILINNKKDSINVFNEIKRLS